MGCFCSKWVGVPLILASKIVACGSLISHTLGLEKISSRGPPWKVGGGSNLAAMLRQRVKLGSKHSGRDGMRCQLFS